MIDFDQQSSNHMDTEDYFRLVQLVLQQSSIRETIQVTSDLGKTCVLDTTDATNTQFKCQQTATLANASHELSFYQYRYTGGSSSLFFSGKSSLSTQYATLTTVKFTKTVYG